MKTNLCCVAHLGISRVVALMVVAGSLLLGGCAAPYGFDHYPRYRARGYGYYDYPHYGYYGGLYSGPYWHGGFSHGFGGHRGFRGGGHFGGGRH